MSWKTFFALVVIVALLGLLAWRQAKHDDIEAAKLDMPLFEDLDEAHVTAVVIENLERDVHLRCERDPVRGWNIVDPVHVRAEGAIFDLIVQSAVARRCTAVPESDLDPKKLGLDPPRFVLELESSGPVGTAASAAPRRQRVEIGALDVDEKSMHARVRGKIVRVLRDLNTELELPIDQYKSHSVTEFLARDVVEFHRSGSVVLEGDKTPTDMKLDALAEQGSWRATAPFEAALDPVAMGLLAQGSAGLRFDSFLDHGTQPQSALGLDPPELRVRIGTAGTQSTVLCFGRRNAPGHDWVGMVEGEPHVFTLEERAVFLLAAPIETLLDHQLFRLPRAQVDKVELHSAEREVELVRDRLGWTVAEARPGSRVFGPHLAVEKSRAEDLLAKLEKAEVSSFKPDWKFDPAESKDAIVVHAGASVAGALLGTEYAPATGGRAIRYQRQGDSIVGLVDPDVLAIARTSPQDLWSLKIGDFPEITLTGMTLSGFAHEIRYERANGLWKRAGAELEARELRPVLDGLFFLRASEHLPESGQPKLADPIRIELLMGAEKREFTIGTVERGGMARVEIEFEGRRSVLKQQDLYAKLAAILHG